MTEPQGKPKPEIIVVHESVWQSFVKDAISVSLAACMIGVGKLIESNAAQWVGFILFCLTMISIAKRSLDRHGRLTPQGAAEYIRDKWGAVAAPKIT